MATRTIIEGKWDEAKGRIREAWGDLTDDDIDRTRGSWEQLVGVIRQRTGEGINQIESSLNELLDGLLEPQNEDTQETATARR